MQVVNQLIKNDKNFDLLAIPGANHTSGGVYGDDKRWDFFVQHLLEVNPPKVDPGDEGDRHRRAGRRRAGRRGSAQITLGY